MSTHIEWTDATWNPLTGCTRISEGCQNCYIERQPPMRMAHRRFDGPQIGATTGVQLHPHRLNAPLHWRKPRRVFVNSMSDLFHEDVPDDFIAKVFGVMAHADTHTYQVLTKRPARMRSLLSSDAFRELVFKSVEVDVGDVMGDRWPLPNVWIGTSVESQRWADTRIPQLLDTPAAVRFISAEPLLGPVNIYNTSAMDREDAQLDWVIVGGESGPGARPMHPDWARGLRDECQSGARAWGDSIAFHFKQWGEFRPVTPDHPDNRTVNDYLVPLSGDPAIRIGDVPHAAALAPSTYATMRRVGKKVAGRKLEGRTWDEYPT